MPSTTRLKTKPLLPMMHTNRIQPTKTSKPGIKLRVSVTLPKSRRRPLRVITAPPPRKLQPPRPPKPRPTRPLPAPRLPKPRRTRP